VLKRTAFGQRWYLPAVLIALLPLASALLEGRPAEEHPPENVVSRAMIGVPPQDAHARIVFFEEVKRPPPVLLRLGLPRPLYTTGSAEAPGDLKVCVYDRGVLTKRISRVQRGRLFEFDIVEQRLGLEHDVRLLDGRFELEPAGPDRTLVRLTTTYVPLLSPRWCWRPFERLAVHALHSHVLRGMAEAGEAALARSRRALAGDLPLPAPETDDGRGDPD
jgi:hypothetical protein